MRNNKQSIPRLGEHLILDVWGGSMLDDVAYIENALIYMAHAAGATLIKTFIHRFGPNSGVTGVAILAESHISIHTWPEYNYAAFDIFMCGNADVLKVMPVIQEWFAPEKAETSILSRGNMSEL